MNLFRSPKCILLTLLFLVVSPTIKVTAQDELVGCGVQRSLLNDVLDTRFGQAMQYSQSVTSGVSSLLNEDCQAAASNFKNAYALHPTPPVASILEKLSGVAVAPPAKQEAPAQNVAPVDAAPEAAANPSVEPVVVPKESAAEVVGVTSTTSEEQAAPVEAEKKAFTAAEIASFQAKGLSKVKRLTEYLNIISDRSTPTNTSISTVESALALFDGEDHTVEVSSINRPEKSRFPVRTYFNRLRMLNYSKVVIEGAAFTYVSSFRKGPDGYYYGIARFRQTFTGYKDNRPVYSDVTTKTVSVQLRPYQKAIEGEAMENWDVFLGDISVTQTQR